MRSIRLVLCLALAAALGAGAPLPAQRRTILQPAYFQAFEAYEIKGNLTYVKLRNGLTIVIEEDTLDPLASIVTFVKAGSRQQGEEAGVALLLERAFLFASGLPERAERLGALLDVETRSDSTIVSSSGPADSAREMLEIHAATIDAPQFARDGIGREIRMIRNEQTGDSPHWMKTEKESQEALSAFHRNYYHPRNLILSVAGAVRREEILEKVVELYGELHSSEETRQPWAGAVDAPAIDGGFQYTHVRKDIPAPTIVMAYGVPGFAHEDYYPLLLLSYVLRGRGGLLYSLIEEGSASRIQTRLDVNREQGTFFITLRPDPEKIDHAEVGVLAQLEALRRGGVPTAALDRAKTLVMNEHYRRLESLPGRARLLAEFEAKGGFLQRDRLAQQLQEISPAALNRTLHRYFGERNLALSETFPQQTEQRTFTPESLMETLHLLVPTVVQKKLDMLESLAALQDKSTFEPLDFVPKYLKRELKRTSILRGPEIYFEEDHRVPLAHLGFFYGGGRTEESEENAGITELMLRVMLNNLGARETWFWTRLEQLGMEIEVVNEWEFFGYRITVPSPHLKEAFGLVIDWLHQPAISDAALKLARNQVLSELAGREENAFDQLRHLTQNRLFGQDPYGLSRWGTRKGVSAVDLKEIQAWMVRVVAVHPWIMVRGDINGTNFLQDFVSTLSEPRFEASKLSNRRDTGEEGIKWKPAFTQLHGNLGAAFPAPPQASHDDALMEILRGVLAGSSGRLTASLRNETQVVSDVEIRHEAGLRGGAVFIRLRTAAEQEEMAREALVTELEKLETEPLRTTRFPDILVGAITRFYLQRSLGEESLIEMTQNIVAGADTGYEEKHLSRIRNAGPDDFMLLMKNYFTDVVVVQPAAEEPPPEEVEEDPEPEAEESSRPRPTLRREGEPP